MPWLPFVLAGYINFEDGNLLSNSNRHLPNKYLDYQTWQVRPYTHNTARYMRKRLCSKVLPNDNVRHWGRHSVPIQCSLVSFSFLLLCCFSPSITANVVAGGTSQTIALSSNGSLFSWGGNDNGQLGDGTTIDKLSPVSVNVTGLLNGKNITKVYAGWFHTMALQVMDSSFHGEIMFMVNLVMEPPLIDYLQFQWT